MHWFPLLQVHRCTFPSSSQNQKLSGVFVCFRNMPADGPLESVQVFGRKTHHSSFPVQEGGRPDQGERQT